MDSTETTDGTKPIEPAPTPARATAETAVVAGPGSEPGAVFSGVPSIAGYEVGRELGRGGMAVVHEARHPKLGRVAVKVLRRLDERTVKSFHAECKLVERIAHEAVVPVYETFTSEQGFPGCALELIDGSTLAVLLEKGEVPTTRALAIVASAAQALAAVHAAGIVHRDLKPANLLIENEGRVRLLDFGVAKDLRDPKGGLDGVAGTPRYLSPEQAQALETGPATDVWAMGVVLYQLLTGELPFDAASFPELIYAICYKEPKPPRSLNPAIDPRVEAAVLRCLEKEPGARYQHGGQLAQELEPLVGRRVVSALAPVKLLLSAAEKARPAPPPEPKLTPGPDALVFRYVWELGGTPERLWPLVSNTEKFNKASGLPPVSLVDEPDGKGGTRRIGRTRWIGFELEWVEYPFEWVAPLKQGVVRAYRRGPIQSLASEVQLEPRSEGGTTVIHTVRVAPRGLLGKIAARIELGLLLRGRVEAVYRKIDAFVSRVPAGKPVPLEGAEDPYESGTRLAPGGEERLRHGLAKVAADARLAALVPSLEREIRKAPDPDAARMRPYTLARRWGTTRPNALAIACEAVRAGVLEPEWQLLCPLCRVPVEQVGSFEEIRAKGHCPSCQISFDNDFAKSVELVFRPASGIRPIPKLTYCLGGPGNFPHVVLQQEIEPGETRALTIKLSPGVYRFVARGLKPEWEIAVNEGSQVQASEVRLEQDSLRAGPPLVAAGLHHLTIENASTARRLVRIETAAGRGDALTALEACGLREVRSLRVVKGNKEPVRVARAAFVAAALDPRSSTDEQYLELDGLVEAAVGEIGGARFRRGRTFVVALAEPVDALELAFKVRASARETRTLAAQKPRLAVTAGAAVAISLEAGKVEWKGVPPEAALWLIDECQPGEVATTHLVLGFPGVNQLVGTRESRVQTRSIGAEGQGAVVYLGGA